jgi:hypothetical protein
MILPSFHASRAAQASASGSDTTPNAVNWANVGQIVNNRTFTYSAQQITGINTAITLQITCSTSFNRLVYKVQSTSTVPASDSAPTVNGYTNIADNGTLTVSNNQWLVFCARSLPGSSPSATVTVINTSNGNATLDTFFAQSRSQGF